MKKSVLMVIFLAVIVNYTNSQDLKNIRNATDCKNAIEISTLSKFGPTNSPKELKVKSTNNPFERAQYPVWYRFTIAKDGVLLFDIIPIDPKDNYDFLLYKIDDNNYCSKIKSGELEAIRSNFERTDIALQGKTGLSITGKPESYSKGIDVKKGEQYLLVLNNMYKGKGHTLTFSYLENFIVKGNITNSSTGEPIKANIYWMNLRTKETTASNEANKQGDYKLKVSVSTEVHRFPKYLLWAYTDKYYIADTIIASKSIDNLQNGTFNFKLHKLKKGNNDFLPKIYFDPNSDNINSDSYTDLERLYRLLNQNQQLEIILEGHSNGFYPSNDVDKALSESRAEKVKDYLVDKGVDEKRIGIKGLGSNKMIYPYAENEKQESANRRVEIFIVKY
jgi:outer membrane protein OmpA-like peptidoglycan-associated protein